MKHGLFSFECSMLRLNEQKKRFLFCGNHKTLSRFELNLKRRLIVVDVRFKTFGSIPWVIFWDIAHFQHSVQTITCERKCLMDHSSVTAVSKNVGESDKEPRKIMRLTATKSHLIKLVYSLGEGAIKICYRKLRVVLRFSLSTFGKIKERKRRKNKDMMGDKKNKRYL